jgi:hypothetical protein
MEREAEALEARAAWLRQTARQYREQFGGRPGLVLPPITVAATGTATAPVKRITSALTGLSLPLAAHKVLRQAGTPLHFSEVEARLRAGGISLPADSRGARLRIGKALDRRRDLFVRVGRGTFSAVVTDAPPRTRPAREPRETRRREPGAKGDTTALVFDYIARYPGHTRSEIAKRLAPQIKSGAKDHVKLIHSIAGYLIGKDKVVVDNEGRLSVPDDVGPHHAANNGNSPAVSG